MDSKEYLFFYKSYINFGNSLFIFIFLLSCSLYGTNSHAQEDVLELLYGDEETVNIATGSSKALHLAPAIATVITDEDIKAFGANSLEDILRSVPGMHISLRDRYGSHYSMRGVYTTQAPQILVLLNGYPISEVYSGARIPTLKVPAKNIKRVEIIRGPGSAVYGADAFSGVINVITYSANELEKIQIGAAVGSFDTYGFWLNSSVDISDWKLGIHLEWEQSLGDKDRIVDRDLQSNFDGIFMTNASNAPSYANTNYEYLNSQIQLSKNQFFFSLYSYHQDDTGVGTGIADALDPSGNQYFLQHIFEAKFSGEENQSGWRFDANVNYFYLKQKSHYTIFPAGTVLPIGSDGNLDFVAPAGVVFFPDGYIGNPGGQDHYYSGDFIAYYSFLEQHNLRFASGYKNQDAKVNETLNFGPGVIDGTQPVVDGTLTDITGTENIFLPDRDRQQYYFSIQDEWSFYTDWNLTAGIRFDDYSDFGSTINPRLALVWQTNYRLTSKLLYGHAFRAPSISELNVVNNPQILGNENIEPEEVDTLELSFDYRHSYDLKTHLNLYHYQIDGLITFVADNNGTGSSTAQNALDQTGYGFEIETNWIASEKLELTANFAWQHSEDDNTNNEIPNAPQKLAYAEAKWKFSNKLALGAQINYVADRARSSSDLRETLDDYMLANLNIYTDGFSPYWDAALSFHNLFDEKAFEPGSESVLIDHPLQGRSVMLKVEFAIK